MSEYTKKVTNHGVYERIRLLEDALESTQELSNLSTEDAETLARISMILENFEVALGTCNENFISLSWLDDVSGAVSNLTNYLNSFKNNRNTSSLVSNCASHLTTILFISSKLYSVKGKESLRGLTNSIKRYQDIMSEHSNTLHEQIEELTQKVEELSNVISSNASASETDLEELRTEIVKEKKRLEQITDEHRKQTTTVQEKLSDIISGFKSEFATEKIEREKRYGQEISLVEEQGKKIQEEAETQRRELEQEGERLIEEWTKRLEEYMEQAKSIVGILTTNTVSHEYRATALKAEKRALKWQRATVALMIATGVFACIFFLNKGGDGDWVNLVSKIIITTSFASATAYSARQASKQEKVEQYTKNIELELTAIDPFIESLDDERRKVVKEELSKRLFGNNGVLGVDSKNEEDEVTTGGLLSQALAITEKVVDAKNK